MSNEHDGFIKKSKSKLTDFGTDIKGTKTGTLFDCDFNDASVHSYYE